MLLTMSLTMGGPHDKHYVEGMKSLVITTHGDFSHHFVLLYICFLYNTREKKDGGYERGELTTKNNIDHHVDIIC